jgi:hypothetical protein
LLGFYERVRPSAAGWQRIHRLAAPAPAADSLGIALIDWIAGMGLVFGTLFAIGKFVLAEPVTGTLYAILALICGAVIARNLSKTPAARVAAVTITALAIALLPLNARADGEKILTNVKGQVSYEHTGTPHTLVPKVRHVLIDDDVAVTQTDSQAQVTLPDSSRIQLGSSTRIAMSFFNQTDIATAKFIVYQGKTRFTVEHPAGAKADYTFTTPTSNIAVRGTEGDIAVDGDSLTLNVYNSSNPDGVAVTFTKGDKIGTTVKVLAGQSLVAQLVNGIIQSNVDKITDAALAKFNELGIPTNITDAKNQAIDKIKQAIPIPRRFPF